MIRRTKIANNNSWGFFFKFAWSMGWLSKWQTRGMMWQFPLPHVQA